MEESRYVKPPSYSVATCGIPLKCLRKHCRLRFTSHNISKAVHAKQHMRRTITTRSHIECPKIRHSHSHTFFLHSTLHLVSAMSTTTLIPPIHIRPKAILHFTNLQRYFHSPRRLHDRTMNILSFVVAPIVTLNRPLMRIEYRVWREANCFALWLPQIILCVVEGVAHEFGVRCEAGEVDFVIDYEGVVGHV